MNNELKEMLQSVIQEALEPLHNDIQSLKSGQSELYQLVRAIHDRQEETDAKLEALSMDVHKLHGVVSGHTEKIKQTSQDVKLILENQTSIYEILGEHEVSIRTLRRKPV